MAYKSLLLSLALTIIVGYTLTVGLTSPNSLTKKLPEWTAIPSIIIVFVLYVIAAWWAFKGFGDHKWTALFSLGLCVFGIGLYVLAAVMELGNGKAAPGQYDHSFSRLDAGEQTALNQILQNAGLTMQDATFSEHWHLSEPAPGFRVCVQKGHINALHFSDKSIPDLSLFSQLPQLGWLHLDHCNLTDLSALRSEKMDRLDLSDNQITDLKTLAGCPNVQWLTLKNNQLQSEDGIELFAKLVSKDLSGNPFSK